LRPGIDGPQDIVDNYGDIVLTGCGWRAQALGKAADNVLAAKESPSRSVLAITLTNMCSDRG